MNRIFVLGALGYYNNQLDGQTIKTRNVFELIKEKFEGKVSYVDTLDVRRNPWKIFTLAWELLKCNKLVLVPCTNNLDVIFPITYYLSKIFRYDIIHICIGGWQVEYFMGSDIKIQDGEDSYENNAIDKPRWTPHPLQLKLNKKIKAIMPEMKTEVAELEKLGFTNVVFLPNFRMVSPVWRTVERSKHNELRLVFMARIMKMKGYETVFSFSEYAKDNKLNVIIDFYGQINSEESEYFTRLIEEHDNTHYCGYLTPDKITATLINYDVMMLPTRFYTESLPGTVLDSYIAGIPIIATNWKYATEFIEDDVNGFIVPFRDGQEEFNRKLRKLYDDREKLKQMKDASAKEAMNYSDSTAWDRLKKYLYD